MSHINQAKPSVLLVSIDALKSEFILEQERLGVSLPNISHYFLRHGRVAQTGVKGVFPTFTYPSHQSMITGVNPARHGITNNIMFDPTGKLKGAWHWFATQKVETLWAAAKQSGYCVGSVAFPTSLGAKGDYIIPEFWWNNSALDSEFISALCVPQGLALEMMSEIGLCPNGIDLSDEGDRARFLCHNVASSA